MADRDADAAVDALAKVANDHHAALCGLAKRGLAHALAAGAALNEAESKFRPSPGYTWRNWMEQHLSFSGSTARWYMRIDHFRDELPDDITTMKGAMHFLREKRLQVRETLSDEEIATIYALFDNGIGQTTIAQVVGISKQGVHHHITKRPERERKQSRPRRQPIDDFMIERVASWLVARFADAGYFVRINDQVRCDATELLRIVFGAEESIKQEAA